MNYSEKTNELNIARKCGKETVVALAGNPNVGKSTVFNELTGLDQHTGNWPGKTVSTAQGGYSCSGGDYLLVDLPGTYSLSASSAEEEVARDFLCFGDYDCVLIVMDATNIERNLNFTLQVLEVTSKAVVCLNLCDEAERKGIVIDEDELSLLLGVPVVKAAARSGKGMEELKSAVKSVALNERRTFCVKTEYPEHIESAISSLSGVINSEPSTKISKRKLCLIALEREQSFLSAVSEYLGEDLISALDLAQKSDIINKETARDEIAAAIVSRSEQIAKECVFFKNGDHTLRDRRIDRVLTSKRTGIPIMLLLLSLIFFLTMVGANYPSDWLSSLFDYIGTLLYKAFHYLGVPSFLEGLLLDGVYGTLSWVISVMLPPMAIFFPLFTILEDLGYLPRIAFNLDKFFKKAGAHGKQALTMCMGFGCNACGVTGCRIIDSPRERKIAVVTNNFVPCNGRFPMLIAVINMFLVGAVALPLRSAAAAAVLTAVILLGVGATLLCSKLLSLTVLKGVPSSFALELPPYRRPQIGRVIVRSLFDRTAFVLSRAIAVAAPAGAIIWLFSNISVGGSSLLVTFSSALDPIGRFFGLDGMILMGFLLGFPANEIVVPIILMGYLGAGTMPSLGGFAETGALLSANGWTVTTAVCFLIFSLMHFPCATTCITIYKETKSLKWTLFSVFLPTACGLVLCASVNALSLLCQTI